MTEQKHIIWSSELDYEGWRVYGWRFPASREAVRER